MSTNSIQFLLDDEIVILNDIDPNITVLQYLRDHRFKKGTKEGCASGDCGACTVVIAELDAELDTVAKQHKLHYKSINACITFVASLHGKQLITVENLAQGNKLHPVQQALVDHHGSQCGFCTPGFVMSSFALHKNNPKPSREEVVEDLAGNLCRCTGYRPIIDAAMQSSSDEEDSFCQNVQQTIEKLKIIEQSSEATLDLTLANKNHSYFAAKSVEQLSALYLAHPDAILLAGGTDLALEVTQRLTDFEKIIYLGAVKELKSIKQTDDEIIIGAGATYSDFLDILAKEYPDFKDLIERIAAKQVRNTGTLAGNIANASPIGDMPPALIALGAEMLLQVGDKQRRVSVEEFFTGYRQTILKPSEFIREVYIPKAKPNQVLKLYKISKRFDDDISAVLAAISITLDKQKVESINIAYGGMAATPKRAIQCEKVLAGKPFTEENVIAAVKALADDFKPMNDVRASADYRLSVAQNLIMKCFLELTDTSIKTRVLAHA